MAASKYKGYTAACGVELPLRSSGNSHPLSASQSLHHCPRADRLLLRCCLQQRHLSILQGPQCVNAVSLSFSRMNWFNQTRYINALLCFRNFLAALSSSLSSPFLVCFFSFFCFLLFLCFPLPCAASLPGPKFQIYFHCQYYEIGKTSKGAIMTHRTACAQGDLEVFG